MDSEHNPDSTTSTGGNLDPVHVLIPLGVSWLVVSGELVRHTAPELSVRLSAPAGIAPGALAELTAHLSQQPSLQVAFNAAGMPGDGRPLAGTYHGSTTTDGALTLHCSYEQQATIAPPPRVH